jgi:hypothetical protein
MARIRAALLNGPKSVDDIIHLGISRATSYRDLGVLLKSGEVTQSENIDNGNVRVVYALTSATPPANDEPVREALARLKSGNTLVREQALFDLESISKKSRIMDTKTLLLLISQAKTEPSYSMLEILAHQAIHAQKDQDAHTIEVLHAFIPTATSVAINTAKSIEAREQALRFLQLTADFDTLSELAIKIVAEPKDSALTASNPTQFAIDIQTLCAKAARLTKYRSKIYDLLLKEAAVVTRAQQILTLSREPPFL